MGSDLIALAVAVGLGIVVVAAGWRRDLSAATRENLPRPGEGSGAPTVGLWEGERRAEGRWRPSPRQARRLAALYLVLGIGYGALAIPDGSLDYTVIGAGFIVLAVLLWLRKWPYSRYVSRDERSAG